MLLLFDSFDTKRMPRHGDNNEKRIMIFVEFFILAPRTHTHSHIELISPRDYLIASMVLLIDPLHTIHPYDTGRAPLCWFRLLSITDDQTTELKTCFVFLFLTWAFTLHCVHYTTRCDDMKCMWWWLILFKLHKISFAINAKRIDGMFIHNSVEMTF